MAQQLVNVGNTASDGTGDELRDAFTKINDNFDELYSGNVQVTAANIRVYSVAGRTGNVILTVSDITGGVSKAYVNAAIAANIANVSGATYNSINANVAAANVVISNHSARITTLESNAASQALQINSLVSVKANISYVDVSIDNALSNSAIGANLSAINANITAANAAITVLQTNAATQATSINTINANLGTATTNITTLFSNAATQAVTLTTLVSNASSQSADLDSLIANTSAQENKIGLINSNVTAINVLITNLFSNAADQTTTLNTLTAANATQSSQLNTLTANAASQAVSISSLESTVSGHTSSISTLTANAASQAVSISSLYSNAASQSVDIASISSYTSILIGNVVTLTANAATQEIDITGLRANINAANSALNANIIAANSTINANLGSYQIYANANVGTLHLGNISTNANLGAYQTYANANAASQTLSITQLTNTNNLTNVHIGNLYANVSSLQANIVTRANVNSVNGASFSGNVQAPNLIASNLYVTTAFIGIDPGITYPSWGGTVIGNVDSPYNFNLQNRSSGSTASGAFTVFSNDAANYVKLEKLNTNSGNLLFENSGLSVFPSDGGVSVVGGNAFIRSTGNIFFVANTYRFGIFDDGTVYVSGNITSPGNLTVESVSTTGTVYVAGSITSPGNLSVGNVSTSGTVYVAGNITSPGNLTVGNISATGNISSGTVYVAGNITSPGNLTVGNVSTTGNISYTMGNAAHWTTPVTNVAAALNQLALRIWNIENT